MPNSPKMLNTKKAILDWFRIGEFERAFDALEYFSDSLLDADIEFLLADLEKALDGAAALRDGQAVRRTRNRISALALCRKNGFHRRAIVPTVSIPPAYRGKVLLVAMLGGLLDNLLCVRSDDLYHREILKNVQLEISDLGLRSTTAHPLGGAYLRDGGEDDRVAIWGGSGDFGACDKEFLAEFLRPFYPGRSVVVEG